MVSLTYLTHSKTQGPVLQNGTRSQNLSAEDEGTNKMKINLIERSVLSKFDNITEPEIR